MKTSRREFTLMSTGAVLGTIAVPSALGSLTIEKPSPKTANIPWYCRIKRVGQTNLCCAHRSSHPIRLHPRRQSAEKSLSKYTALILPNVALLSDAQCRILEQFVERGGSVLATFETGLYDETSKPRADFSLGHLFGISKTGSRERAKDKSTQSTSSVHLQKILYRNAITTGFEDTEWIAGPIWIVPLVPIQNPIMTFIDPYPTYPPEAVYMREAPTNIPSVVLQERGRARLAYLSGDMDASYWRLDNWDLGRQLLNTIQWVLGDCNPVKVEGEGLIEVFAWETEPGFALHMVNYNGPNAYRGKMRKPITLGPQSVRIELPRDVAIKRASRLRAETLLNFQQHGRIIEFIVPSVGSYEVVALEI